CEEALMDKCGICFGDNSACEVVTGTFTRSILSVGYHKILEIPKGATEIKIKEMVKSTNYLAIRDQHGEAVINGNWAIDRPGQFLAAGTTFTYKRPNEIRSKAGESITAQGPTNEVLHIYVIYQQANPSVYYDQLGPYTVNGQSYSLSDANGDNFVNGVHTNQVSVEQFTPTTLQPYDSALWDDRNESQTAYNWKYAGMTPCSASCGGGTQFPLFICVERSTHEPVSESLCDEHSRPTPEEEACNTQPCPAFWDIGEWSECSKTCGPGIQHRQVLCRQATVNQTTTVPPHHCRYLEKPATTTTCQLKICSEWQIRTEWTSCSVPCGVGQRTRDIKCVDNLGDVVEDEECNMKLKPGDSENCDMGACSKSWFITEWSDRCSAECGSGSQTRDVVCLMNHISSLPLEGCGNEKPTETKACDFGPCHEKVDWYTGPWGQCSAECGNGTKTRSVVCLRQSNSSFMEADLWECGHLQPPPAAQDCFLKKCGAKWFTTEWSVCSKSCEGGYRVREVRCLADDKTQSSNCDPFLMPEDREECNIHQCIPEIDENCKDMYFNCNVVVQARLCVYSYYRTACCASCSKVSRREA
ncbi:THSD4 protein, partial [Amia calva]|nr:THSD4 protein [Amia calva]